MDNNHSQKHQVGDLVSCKHGKGSRLGTIIDVNCVPYYGIQGFESVGIKNSENRLENIYSVLWSDSSLTWHLEYEIIPSSGR
jgi:hypothetical protein